MIKYLLYICTIFTLTNAFKLKKELQKEYKVQIINDSQNEQYPKKHDSIKVHFTGNLHHGGKQFDSSFDRRQPYEFQIGKGQVVPCWDEVLMYMTVGDKIKMTCPSQKAYGHRGAGRLIPANADLDYEIEMLAFSSYKIEDL